MTFEEWWDGYTLTNRHELTTEDLKNCYEAGMSDYKVDAVSKEDWAERALRAEDTVVYLRSEVSHLRCRIKDLETELDAGDSKPVRW